MGIKFIVDTCITTALQSSEMHYIRKGSDMKTEQAGTKDQTVIFRAPKPVVASLDKLAKLIGGNRSEALRRLIPDLTPRKE